MEARRSGLLQKYTGLFYKASGMLISEKKSIFLYHGLLESEMEIFRNTFPYEFRPVEDGTKYLGYYLKPNKYTNYAQIYRIIFFLV